jgi:hypothetical protein
VRAHLLKDQGVPVQVAHLRMACDAAGQRSPLLAPPTSPTRRHPMPNRPGNAPPPMYLAICLAACLRVALNHTRGTESHRPDPLFPNFAAVP